MYIKKNLTKFNELFLRLTSVYELIISVSLWHFYKSYSYLCICLFNFKQFKFNNVYFLLEKYSIHFVFGIISTHLKIYKAEHTPSYGIILLSVTY